MFQDHWMDVLQGSQAYQIPKFTVGFPTVLPWMYSDAFPQLFGHWAFTGSDRNKLNEGTKEVRQDIPRDSNVKQWIYRVMWCSTETHHFLANHHNSSINGPFYNSQAPTLNRLCNVLTPHAFKCSFGQGAGNLLLCCVCFGGPAEVPEHLADCRYLTTDPLVYEMICIYIYIHIYICMYL